MTYVVGSAEIEVVPSMKGFHEKLDAETRDLSAGLQLDPDIAGLKAQLKEIGDVKVKVDLDMGDSALKIEALTHPRDLIINPVVLPTAAPQGAAAGAAASAGSTAAGTGMTAVAVGVTALVALAPALIPIAGAITAITFALTSMTAAATAGGAAFAMLLMYVLANDKAFVAQLQPALDGLSKTFAAFEKVNIGNLLGPLNDGIKLAATLLPLATPIIKAVSSALETLIGLIQGAVNSGVVGRLFNQIAQWTGPAIVGIGTFLGNLAIGLGDMLQAYAPFGQVVLNGLNAWATGFSKIGSDPTFKNFVAWSVQNVPLFLDLLGGLGRVVIDVVKALTPLGDAVLKAIDALLKGDGAGLGKALGTVVAQLGDLLSKAIPAVLPVIAYGFISLIDGLAKSVPKWAPPLLAAINSLMTTVLPMAQPLLVKVGGQLASDIIIGLTDPKTIGTLSASVGISVKTALFESLATTVPAILGYAHTLVANFADAGKRSFTDGLLAGMIQGFAVALLWLGHVPGWIGNSMVGADKWLSGHGKEVITGLLNGMVSGFVGLLVWLGTVGGRVGNALVGADQWLTARGQQVISGFGAGLNNGWSQIAGFFHGLGGRIGGALVGADQWLIGAGEAIVNGLGQGIQRAWGRVMATVHSLVSSIPPAVAHLLGINSPSKVMDVLGDFTGQGYEHGLVRSLNRAMDAAQATLRARTNTFAATASSTVTHQLNASTLGGSAQTDLLVQLIEVLKALLTKTPSAQDIARANQLLARAGVMA